jgi:hypothetical protein
MPGLVPGIHAFAFVDGRVKPGHDDERKRFERSNAGFRPA